MILNLRRPIAAILFVPIVVFFGARAALAQAGPAIPWDPALTITRTSADEDIKNVLRGLLQANGNSVIFSPDVQGPVSFHLDRVPVSAAFEQLIQEHNLAYGYNPATNTVNVTTLAADLQRVKSGSFVPLDSVSYDELTRAMMNFGLPAQNLKYDPGTRTVSIGGDMEHAQQIADLGKALDAAPAVRATAMDRLRKVIDRVDIIPTIGGRGAGFEVRLVGKLADLLTLARGGNVGGTDGGYGLVRVEGIEPPWP